MIKKILLIWLLFFSFGAYSQITNVTVYQDRALVTRTQNIKGSEGNGEMIFKNIPLNTNLDSLRAKGFVSKGSSLKILDIHTEKNYTNITSEELDKLKNQIENEKRNILKLNSQKQRLLDQKKNLEVFSNKVQQTTGDNLNNGTFNPKQWEDALNIYAIKLEKLDTEFLNTNEEIKKVNEKLRILNDQYNHGVSGNSIYSLDVYVSYKLGKESELTILLNYIVNNSYWYPVYDCRTDLKTNIVTIEYYAKVYQKTGEDWNNVNLILSTARPDLSGQIPQIYPWEIGYNESIPIKKDKTKRLEKKELMDFSKSSADEEEMKAPAPEELQEEDKNVAIVESEGLALEYTISSKSTIISGKKDTRVTISSGIDLNPDLSWTIVPRLDTSSFLTAKIKNSSIFTFLPGEMSLYVGDSFIGKSSLQMINPGEEFTLSLGRDPRVKAEFKLDNLEKTKILSKNKEKRKYLITLINNSEEDINILVKDSLPKSIQTNKVNVKIIKIEPETKDIESGSIYKWNLKINKNSKTIITEEWEVEYSDGGYIIGL